jgi:hypothetical protein
MVAEPRQACEAELLDTRSDKLVPLRTPRMGALPDVLNACRLVFNVLAMI